MNEQTRYTTTAYPIDKFAVIIKNKLTRRNAFNKFTTKNLVLNYVVKAL